MEMSWTPLLTSNSFRKVNSPLTLKVTLKWSVEMKVHLSWGLWMISMLVLQGLSARHQRCFHAVDWYELCCDFSNSVWHICALEKCVGLYGVRHKRTIQDMNISSMKISSCSSNEMMFFHTSEDIFLTSQPSECVYKWVAKMNYRSVKRNFLAWRMPFMEVGVRFSRGA